MKNYYHDHKILGDGFVGDILHCEHGDKVDDEHDDHRIGGHHHSNLLQKYSKVLHFYVLDYQYNHPDQRLASSR